MIKKVTILCFFLVLSTLLFAQKANMSCKLADKEYAKMHYADAADLYEQSLINDSTNTESLKKLANCYYKIQESSKAERVYKKLFNLGYQDTDASLAYAEVLSRNGKYEDAMYWYAKYDEMMPGDARGKNFAIMYENLKKFYADSSRYKVYFVNFNTEQADFSPIPYDSGLVFASARVQGSGIRRVYGWNNTSYLDMYYIDTNKIKKNIFYTPIIQDQDDTTSYTKFQEKNPLKPDETRITSNDTKTIGFNGHYYKKHNLKSDSSIVFASKFSKKLNTKYHDGPCAFDGDSVIYFTRNNYNKLKSSKSKEKVNKLKLYYAKKVNGSWSSAKEMPFNSNEYSVGHPALSNDKKTLYFSSDMPGTNGGTDIFKSIKNENGIWSFPENLGEGINTAGSEMFPYVDANDNLYYASNGIPGLGGLDIFKVKLTGGTPKNLGYPINSKKDDFGFIIHANMKQGYFSSNRKRGGPDDDIYMFDYKPGIKLEGIIVYIKDDSPVDNASIRLDEKDENLVPEKQNENDGKFVFDGLEPNRTYKIPVKRIGFADQLAEINTFGLQAGEVLQVKIYLDKPFSLSLEGTLTDRDTDPINYELITLVNKNTSEISKIRADENGRFYANLSQNTDYEVYGTRAELKSNVETFTTKNATESKTILAFLNIQTPNDCDLNKRKYFIENTFYDLDKAEIRADAKIILDKTIKLMSTETDLTLAFTSQTDSRASGTYNQRLALRRSNAVLKYLQAAGIPTNRLTILVSKEPVQGCLNENYCDEAKQQSGRRTTYCLVKNGQCLDKVRCKDGVIALTGKAFSSETLQPMGGVRVSLKDKTEGTVLASTTTADNGLYSFDIKPNKEYVLEAFKDSCADNIQFVITKNMKVKTLNFDSPLLCEGDKIKLEKIFLM